MDVIILVFVIGVCFTQGYNAYNCDKQNKVFNKRNLPLKDVKEYNHFCGKLIYGFGIVAALTMILIVSDNAWGSLAGCILLIIEAVVIMKIYNKNEIKFLRGY